MRLRFLILFLAFARPAPAQWDLEDAHTTADLRGIATTAGGAVWASGTHGTVLRSVRRSVHFSKDRGQVWQTCAIPPGAEALDFRGIQALDENTAIAMSSGPGDLSRLYKTTDGCHTWKLVFTNPDHDGFWDALQFGAAKTQGTRVGTLLGDAVDGRFPVFLSFDDGDHWERQIRQSPSALDHEAIFAASNSSLQLQHGYGLTRLFVTGGSNGPRLLSLFIGRDDTMHDDPVNTAPGAKPFQFVIGTWTATKLPVTSSHESAGAFSIAIGGLHDSMVIVGGDYQEPNATRQTAWFQDRHRNWQPAQMPPHGYRSAVAYDPTRKVWITVGPNGTDISTDDGRTWRALTPLPNQAPDADQHWNALSLPFAVGPKGRIGLLKTSASPK